MPTTLLIAIGVLVLGFIAWKLMIPSLDGVIAKAREERDIAPIVGAINQLRPSARATAYNHAIRKIWDDYDRELAIELVKELARKHNDALIAQYWLDQVQKVEPQLARAALTKDFLQRYYQPEVASRCGPVG